MQTRLATTDDQEFIAALLGQMLDSIIDPSSLTQLPLFINSTDRAIVLAVNPTADVVGMAVVNLVYKLPKTECRIDEVIVSPEVRGQGYGKVLMAGCESWAWQHGADVIELTSRPSREAANGLYSSIGYSLRETNVYVKKRQDTLS